jgi:hypothetical protein
MADKRPALGNTLKEITESVARQRAKGTPVDRIVRQLTQRGWPETAARQFVNAIQVEHVPQRPPDERDMLVRQCQFRALRGFICVIIGLVIIMAGLLSSDAYEGLYYFAMGVLLCTFEAIDFMSGILGWWRNRG